MDYNDALSILNEGCDFKRNVKTKFVSNSDRNTSSGKPKTKKPKLSINLDDLSGDRKLEEVRHVRHMYKIKAFGSDVPDPITSFSQLLTAYGVHKMMIDNLTTLLEFKEPTPVQMQTFPVMIERRESMVCAPTGSGKTASFLLPILNHLVINSSTTPGVRALILAPTLELARQTFHEGEKLGRGLPARFHFLEKAPMTWQQLAEHGLSRDPTLDSWIDKCDVLVTTPNRLVWMLTQKPPQISLKSVEWLVVDECDKLFEKGSRGFRDQLATIYRACEGSSVTRALFSATSMPDLETWAKENLDRLVVVRVGQKNSAVDTVEQSLKYCGTEQGKLLEIRMLARRGLQVPCLIFLESRERAKQLFKELVYEDIMVNLISADKTQTERAGIVAAFDAGNLSVLICTDMMARGIDFKAVRQVINYDVPPSLREYIHRIGRTGRAGQRGRALTLWTDADIKILPPLLGVMKNSGAQVDTELFRLVGRNKKRLRKGDRVKNPRRTLISDTAPPTAPSMDQEASKAPKNGKKRKRSSRKKKKTSPESESSAQVEIVRTKKNLKS